MRQTFVVVDLETTGLRPKYDRILEIGACRIEDGRLTDTFWTMVDPGVEISAHVTALTGITQEMVKGAPTPAEAAEAFFDFCGDLPLLGHHVIFDYSFLKHQAVNQRRDFEKKAVDTLLIARRAFCDLPSRSLEAMCRYYGIEQGQAHRAFDDAKATWRLYQCLWRDFYAEHPKWFEETPLIYKAKRQSPITAAQKQYLKDLIKYHNIECSIDTLTKNEASRRIDQILAEHGRMERKKQ